MLHSGMGKLSFTKWLSLREDLQQGQVELQVARFLEDILDKAAALKKQDLQAGQRQSFTAYVRQVWPQEFIQDTNFLMPNIFPPDIAGKPVQFKLKLGHNAGDTIHDQGVFDGFVFNMMPFNKANSPEEVDNWLAALKSTVHHEAEHIYNVGGEYDSNDYQGDDKHKMAMQYMNNPGELKAHARQMAYLYSQHFPGEPFDLAKAQTILDKPIFTNTMRNYFSSLAKPDVWQKNIEKFGYKHANPHDQIMALVPQYIPQYQA